MVMILRGCLYRPLVVAVSAVTLAGCYASMPEKALIPTALDASIVEHADVVVVIDAPIEGATPAQVAKLERARSIAEHALNDHCLRKRALLFSSTAYGGAPGDGYLHAERAQPAPHPVLSNTEVVVALLDGNGLDGKIHLRVAVTDKGVSMANFAETPFLVAGGITSIFPRWLDEAPDAVVAENLVHEHLHRLGFEHEHGFSIARCASAPYAVGKLVCAFGGGGNCIPRSGEKC